MTATAQPSGIAYVNGAFVPHAEAKVSVFDRGFLFGDGIYEVTAVLDGGLVDNGAHMARLARSLGEIGMAMPEPPERLVALHHELVRRNGLTEGLVYLQVTRGAAEPRDFPFPEGAAPTLVMFAAAKNFVNSPLATSGVRVISVPDQRWARRDIKSVALLAQVLAKQAAAAAGAYEAWMVEDGMVTEGGSSTAFIVNDAGAVVARPNSQKILPGCTRRALVSLLAEGAAALEERPFALEEALAAREAFLTSATSFVMPVVSIDGRPIGDGRPGPVAARLRALYVAHAREEAAASLRDAPRLAAE